MLIKIYIAGKVTGLPAEDVKEKFLRKEKELTAQGYTVYNPVDQLWVKGGQTWTWEKLMRGCITQMMECDEVHLLHDWSESRGARLERDIAERLGMVVVYP